MAKVERGQNYRMYISNVFEQKPPMTGYNVALSLDNGLAENIDGVDSAPMLRYNKYKNEKTGKNDVSYTVGYTKEQFDAITAASNKDGDNLVFEAPLMEKHDKKGNKYHVVDTKRLGAVPEQPFDMEKHRDNTMAKRAANAAKYSQENKAEVVAEDEADELER